MSYNEITKPRQVNIPSGFQVAQVACGANFSAALTSERNGNKEYFEGGGERVEGRAGGERRGERDKGLCVRVGIRKGLRGGGWWWEDRERER